MEIEVTKPYHLPSFWLAFGWVTAYFITYDMAFIAISLILLVGSICSSIYHNQIEIIKHLQNKG